MLLSRSLQSAPQGGGPRASINPSTFLCGGQSLLKTSPPQQSPSACCSYLKYTYSSPPCRAPSHTHPRSTCATTSCAPPLFMQMYDPEVAHQIPSTWTSLRINTPSHFHQSNVWHTRGQSFYCDMTNACYMLLMAERGEGQRYSIRQI